MRNRYRAPDSDDAPLIHDTLRHAYQPPPRRPAAPARPIPADITTPVRPAPTHIPAHERRAETAPQPVRQSIAPAPVYHHAHRRPKRRLWRKIAVVGFVLLLLAAAGAYAYPKYYKTNPFPADIRKSVQTSLFYPEKLPTGYSVAASSFQLANGVLIYTANSGQDRLVFTVQKLPASFDLNNFYKQGLLNTTSFNTDIGQAAIGTANGRLVGSLSDGQTWLLVNSDASQLHPSDLSLILKNIKQVSE